MINHKTDGDLFDGMYLQNSGTPAMEHIQKEDSYDEQNSPLEFFIKLQKKENLGKIRKITKVPKKSVSPI